MCLTTYLTRDEFISDIFSICKILVDKSVISSIAVQIADEYVNKTNLGYTKILERSCYNIVNKYFSDTYYSKEKNIEFEILTVVDWKIRRDNILIWSYNLVDYSRMKNTFIYYMMKEITYKELYNTQPEIILLAMILLKRRNKLKFYNDYKFEKYLDVVQRYLYFKK